MPAARNSRYSSAFAVCSVESRTTRYFRLGGLLGRGMSRPLLICSCHERLQQGDRHLACFCFGVPLCDAPTEVGDHDNEPAFSARLEPYWVVHPALQFTR